MGTTGNSNNRRMTEDTIDLLLYMKLLWHKAWLLVLFATVLGGAFYGYSRYTHVPKYTAVASVYVNSNALSVGSTALSITASDLTASSKLVDTYAFILKARTTLEDTIDRAGLPYSYEELQKMVSAEVVSDTSILKIKATSTDATEAKTIVNQLAMIIPDKVSAIIDGSSLRVVDYAVVPAKADQSNIMRNTVYGALLGFILAAAIIILMETFRDEIRSEEDILKVINLPILAAIPDIMDTDSSEGYNYSYYSSGKGKENTKNVSSK